MAKGKERRIGGGEERSQSVAPTIPALYTHTHTHTGCCRGEREEETRVVRRRTIPRTLNGGETSM